MKSSISTMLDSYVSDNSSYIIENDGNAAEYILADTEAQDQGMTHAAFKREYRKKRMLYNCWNYSIFRNNRELTLQTKNLKQQFRKLTKL